MWGSRAGNFSLQNADLLISIGSRLTYPQTGYDSKDFARNAKHVMVDIDKNVLNKDNLSISLKINCDAKEFLVELKKQLLKL